MAGESFTRYRERTRSPHVSARRVCKDTQNTHVRRARNGEREVPPSSGLPDTTEERAPSARAQGLDAGTGRARNQCNSRIGSATEHGYMENRGENANEQEASGTREPQTRGTGASTAEATGLGHKASGEQGRSSRRCIPIAPQRAQAEPRSSTRRLQVPRYRDDNRGRNTHRRVRNRDGTSNGWHRQHVKLTQALKHNAAMRHHGIGGSSRGAVEHVRNTAVGMARARMQAQQPQRPQESKRAGKTHESHQRPTAGSKTRIRTAASSSG